MSAMRGSISSLRMRDIPRDDLSVPRFSDLSEVYKSNDDDIFPRDSIALSVENTMAAVLSKVSTCIVPAALATDGYLLLVPVTARDRRMRWNALVL